MERLLGRKRATWRWSGLGTAREGFLTAFDCLDLTGNGHLNIKVAGGFNLICFEFSTPLVSLVPFTFLRVIFNFDNFFRISLFLFFFKPQTFQTTVFSFFKIKKVFWLSLLFFCHKKILKNVTTIGAVNIFKINSDSDGSKNWNWFTNKFFSTKIQYIFLLTVPSALLDTWKYYTKFT